MTPNKIPKLISEIIYNSRFPLMVMVVFMHAKLRNHQNFEVYNFFEFTISDFICRVAVPLFYVISGYLFFINSNFTFRSLQEKLKRRIHSILTPYLLWNAIVLGIMIIAELLLPSFRSGTTKPILHYNLLDYIYSFWDTNLINKIDGCGEPIAFQFWFLRDLMISMIIIPLISITIKSKIINLIIISSLFILWILDVDIPIPGFSIVSFFFFYSGIYIYRYHVDIFAMLNNNVVLLFTMMYICLYTLEFFTQSQITLKISILIGIVIFLNFIKILNRFEIMGIKENLQFLSQKSFFLYAAHGVIITFLVKFSLRIIPYNDNGFFSLMYFVNPILTILICNGLYWLLKSKCPRIENLLTGNR